MASPRKVFLRHVAHLNTENLVRLLVPKHHRVARYQWGRPVADIFISYKSERRPAARHLKKVLDCYFQSGAEECVWYDYGLVPGHDFERRIMEEIDQARVVLVLWCRMAVKSHWVGREAEEARRTGKFLPIRIENCELPGVFAGADTINLSEWDASPRSALLDRLLDDVGRRLGREAVSRVSRLRELEEDWRGYGALSLAQFALGKSIEPEAKTTHSRSAQEGLLGPTPPSLSQNLSQHWKNARDGDAAALFQIAGSYHLGNRGLPKNEPEALRLYQCAAAWGDPDAQLVLGFLYEEGQAGLPTNQVEAAHLYALAAAQGNAAAQDRLAAMHAEGRGGLAANDREAARLYQLAADQGNARAQVNLAGMYVDGLGGLPKDDREAVRLCKLSAEQGFAFAHTFLGAMYEAGQGGLEKNETAAVKHYRTAADAGDATAQVYLGSMYEDGRGLPKDVGEAIRLWRLAAASGNEEARQQLIDRGESW